MKRKDHLTRHKHTHSTERPFVCKVCEKTFKRKEQLASHAVIHTGKKPFNCDECDKSKIQFSNTIFKLSGFFIFFTVFCSVGFYRKDHLRKHTRSHMTRRIKAEISRQNPSINLLAVQQHEQPMTPNAHQMNLMVFS